MSGIDGTLAERGTRYGEFKDHAEISQSLKSFMTRCPGWGRLQPFQKEALDMIQHKIGRILNGDPNYHDSWHDIVGYAKLAADRVLELTPDVDTSEDLPRVESAICMRNREPTETVFQIPANTAVFASAAGGARKRALLEVWNRHKDIPAVHRADIFGEETRHCAIGEALVGRGFDEILIKYDAWGSEDATPAEAGRREAWLRTLWTRLYPDGKIYLEQKNGQRARLQHKQEKIA